LRDCSQSIRARNAVHDWQRDPRRQLSTTARTSHLAPRSISDLLKADRPPHARNRCAVALRIERTETTASADESIASAWFDLC
jgi:hypothetical protein